MGHGALPLLAAVALLLGACGGEATPATPAEQGRRVYAANCVACHHMDPTRDGPLGPAVAGSSQALLEARIVRGDYPPEYAPKRGTRVMQALPYLEGDVDSLAAYLNSL